ncbi:MAG: MFS transporter [Thermomicrobiales bacterium]|nr:MFS transporter [Thermomicrobiales bacterium]
MATDRRAKTVAAERGPAKLRGREDRNIHYLYWQTIWQGVIIAVITTFLPIFVVRAGASNLEVGLVTSLPALVAIVLSIPAASFVAARGNLVRVVIVTLIGVWTCSIAITFLPTVLRGGAAAYVPLGIIIISGISAAFSAASNPAWIAVLADAVSPRRRPVVNGQRWAMLSVVGAGTALFAGWYLDAVSFPFGYQSLIIGATLAGLVCLYYLDKLEMTTNGPEVASQLARSPWHILAGVPEMFRRQPAFARYVGTMFVYRLGIALPAALFPIFWVDDLRSSDALIGFRAMSAQAMLVVSYTLWGRAASRRGYRSVLLCCGLGTALYPALTGMVPSPLWLIPVAVIWGFFAGGVDVSLFEGLIDVIPADQRVVYSAINTSFVNLTVLVGPLLGIALAGIIGVRATFGVAGVICAAGALLYFALASVRTAAPAIELQPDPS